jgi:selenide,water dikinase
VLVDAATRDDAAVFRISPDRVLIATVDFFTPIVDDAATWGAIAAANALSDVYAMGGRPLFCLNLVGWPREKLPMELLGEVIAGAAAVATRAGCPMVGGHSIDDPEPKFGLAVIGEAHPDRLMTNAGARPGDALILTKPIGTGILTTALKRDLLAEADLAPAVAAMTTLNDEPARLAAAHGVRTATDVTGFGLIGHLGNVLRASGVGAELGYDSIPLFPQVAALAAAGVVPGGTRRNLEAADAEWAADLTEAERLVAADAQTSGGLLLSVPADRVEGLLVALRAGPSPAAAIIGRVVATPGIRVHRSRAAA